MNTFDQIFLSAIAAQVSELSATVFSGIVFEKFGVRPALSVSFALSAVGGIVMYNYGLWHQKDWIFPFLVLTMKFGIESTFNIVYICHKDCFPTLF